MKLWFCHQNEENKILQINKTSLENIQICNSDEIIKKFIIQMGTHKRLTSICFVDS